MKNVSALRRTSPRKQLLMAASRAAVSAWCTVRQVQAVEVQTLDETSVVKIEVHDSTRLGTPPEYIVKGASVKAVNVPRGEMRVVRVRGSGELTVYALGGL